MQFDMMNDAKQDDEHMALNYLVRVVGDKVEVEIDVTSSVESNLIADAGDMMETPLWRNSCQVSTNFFVCSR